MTEQSRHHSPEEEHDVHENQTRQRAPRPFKWYLLLIPVLLIVGIIILFFGLRSILAPTPALTSGTWRGLGTYNQGKSTFNMALTVTTVQGDSFSGTLEETTYKSTVAIKGSITQSDNSTVVQFTDFKSVSGGSITLNCIYRATLANGQMIDGLWYYPGDKSPSGTFQLKS